MEFLSLLALIGALSSNTECIPVTSKGWLYIALVQLMSPWKALTPEAIDCRGSVGRDGFTSLDSSDFVSTRKWNPHMTETIGGFSCYGLRRKTSCGRSFFWYDSISRETERNGTSLLPKSVRNSTRDTVKTTRSMTDFPFLLVTGWETMWRRWT